MLPIRPEPYAFEQLARPPQAIPEPSLQDVVAGILRHRWLLVLCILVCGAAGAAYTLSVSPVYEATSMLRFEVDRVDLPQLVQVLASDNMISTEMEVLQGRSASLAVVDSLGLRARIVSPKRSRKSDLFTVLRVEPEADTGTIVLRRQGARAFGITGSDSTTVLGVVNEGDTVTVRGVRVSPGVAAFNLPAIEIHVDGVDVAIERFKAGLKVSRPARDADLITIRTRSSDPNESAAASNLLARNVISGQQAFRRGRSSSATTFLEEQGDTLLRQLRSAEDSLSTYQQREHVVDAPEQARSQVTRLANLRASLAVIRADRDAFAKLIAQLRSDSTALGLDGAPASRRLMAFPLLLQNQSASVLLGALAQVETQRAELLIRRTPADSDVQVLTARIRDIEVQLQGIAESFLQSLDNQVESLESEANTFSRELDVLPEKELQLARRQRDVQVLNDLWLLVETRLKESEITGSVTDPTVRLVDRATAPVKPVKPNLLVNLALSLVLGTMVGMTLSLASEVRDRSVRSRADVLAAGWLPILGAVPRIKQPRFRSLARRQDSSPFLPGDSGRAERSENPRTLSSRDRAASRIASLLVTQPDPSAAYVESFNQLFANLTLSHAHRALKVVVFTSPLPGEGKTLSAINFALTGATRGLRMLLIDADLRCGLISNVFGCAREPGFAELLSGTAQVSDALRHVPLPGQDSLLVVPSGALPKVPGRVLTPERVKAVLSALAANAESARVDYVVLDTPPINLLADAAIVGSAADAVILVVRAGTTQADSLRYAIEKLQSAGTPMLGTLLNDIDLKRNAKDDGLYGYISGAERYHGSNG